MFARTKPNAGGYGLGAPPRRSSRARPRLAILTLAVLSVLPVGCSSLRDPCGGGMFSRCGGGPLANCRLFNGGLFRRSTVVAAPVVSDACGEPFLSVPMEGATVIPAPGAVIPAPAAPLELAPAPLESEPIEIEPIPAPAAGSTSSRSTDNQKTLYETLKPPGGTTTSRRSGQSSVGGGLSDSNPAEPLQDLPPLMVSTTPEEGAGPPGSPSADTTTKPDAATSSSTTTKEVAAAVPEPAELPPQPRGSGPISLAPGIARFKVVDAQLAGGSLPNQAGWSFLAEKGYQTVLDLRERDEVQPGDDAAALHAGLRYVALPVTSETIDDGLLKRFENEISMAGSRPLYFFDDDGARAAVLWYLKQIVVDGIDEQSALREVEELGPKVAEYWLAANVYLQNRARAKPTAGPIPSPAPAAAVPPAAEPAPVESPTGPTSETPPSEGVALSASSPTHGAVAHDDDPSLDETSWRPMAAMILTGLSLPLAYVGRSAFNSRVFRRLASLPAPARRRLSLPSKSDA